MKMMIMGGGIVMGQQQPMVNITKFDRQISYRTNVCDRQYMVYNGTIELKHALQNLNLSVSLTNYHTAREKLFFTLQSHNYQIDESYPGLFAIILDELATRAQFTWRNTFIVHTPLDPMIDKNKTWTDKGLREKKCEGKKCEEKTARKKNAKEKTM